MKKNFVLLTAFVFVFLLTNTSTGFGSSLPIIPGGKGFGMDTTAGSGRHLATPSTTVYKVTNLNNSGHGSLRDAIAQATALSGPGTIVFEVSGTIELQSDLWLPSYLTIAGQTAPSPGITIKNRPVQIERNAHDILVQHIRFRVGDKLVGDRPDLVDVLLISNHYNPELEWVVPSNIVIDHCSLSWSIDENIETGADDITFSNNIISEGLASPLHPKGPHSKGLIVLAYNSGVTGGKNTAIIKNLFVHNGGRNPVVFSGSVVVANNLIYDHWEGIKICDGKPKKGPIQVSIVGNYLIETDITVRTMYICAGYQDETRVYLAEDNFFKGSIQTDPWNRVENRIRFDQPASDVPDWARVSSPPVWPSKYITMSATDARTYVLANAGARPADRDSVDIRIVNDVINSTGGIIASQDDVGGWPNLAENHHTLTVPSNPNEVQPSGYTKLEEWLHGFSRTVEGESYISPRTLMLE